MAYQGDHSFLTFMRVGLHECAVGFTSESFSLPSWESIQSVVFKGLFFNKKGHFP